MKLMLVLVIASVEVLQATAITVSDGHLDDARELGSQLEFIGGGYGFSNGGTRSRGGSVFLIDREDYNLDESDNFDIVGLTLHQWELASWESFHVNFSEDFFDFTTTYQIVDFIHVPGTDFGFGLTDRQVQGIRGASLSTVDGQVGDSVIMTGRGESSEMRDSLEWNGDNHAHLAEISRLRYATIQDDIHFLMEFAPNSAYGESGDSGAPLLNADDFYSVLGWNESVFPYHGYGSYTVAGRVNDNIRQTAYDLFGYPTAPVPEPASMTLLGLGVLGLYLKKMKG